VPGTSHARANRPWCARAYAERVGCICHHARAARRATAGAGR
jgi:hypothetical protein